ncbi:enoyl-CoA hydratase/isomerase family protein [Pseudaminobacter sp. 19-2017]|uniref:Enoyl-CoA hydratase/isomerase family protein n=1 Tax=Pseudaminobacter soli (ex Zhang et al. 2022) TaxID=2831468 RepID=A0A942DXA2_9HYPH|nr:enoyl-CoA hydratase-related protein [Pseudaminobacter soli]MBS3649809.1 enoyl-CoA hydratase/isomerase family protein [Pseudaminobacter soli]
MNVGETSGISLREEGEGLFRLTMSNPGKKNALTLDMYRDFGATLKQLDGSDAVRCLVVQGANGDFCAGSDIGGFDGNRSGLELAREYADFTVAMVRTLRDFRHPTVACIEGVCVGGGLEIASVCDIRIAGNSARFGIPVNRIGITLDHAELADLMAVIGRTATLEMLLEGRIFGAEEALRIGLVTRVVDDAAVVAEADAASQRIARSAPLVNRWHKKFVRRLQQPGQLDESEIAEAYACFESEDYEIGRRSFAAKLRPNFVGR